MRHNHNLFIVEETKALGYRDGFNIYQKTGRAAAICACGLSTDFKATAEIEKILDGHDCSLLNPIGLRDLGNSPLTMKTKMVSPDVEESNLDRGTPAAER